MKICDGEKVTFRSKGILPQDLDVAEVWMGEDHRLHIKMCMDDVFDVVFEDLGSLRPRTVSPDPEKEAR